MEVSSLHEETKLDDKLEKLLNQFEREVEPYDRFSAFSMFATPIGIVLSIFLPLAYLQFVAGVNPFASMVPTGIIYWIVGGMLATVGLTKLPIFYADHKKHEISKTKDNACQAGEILQATDWLGINFFLPTRQC